MAKDYYEILGLTEDDKKLPYNEFKKKAHKLYRQLSVKYHPDKNNGDKEAEEKFKDITEAYNTLSDEKKKQTYDAQNSGFGGFGNGFNPFGGFDFGGDPFDMMRGFNFGQQSHPQQKRGGDLRISVNVSLEDVLNGATKTFKFTKNVTCSHCKGTGSKDGKTSVCPQCQGTGRIQQVQQIGGTTMIQQGMCPACGGTGKRVTNPCSHCAGTGVKKETVNKTIDIPKGVYEGSFATYANEGNAPTYADGKGINGNLIIVFHILPHPVFTVEGGNNLKMDLKLNLLEAWGGCEKEINCLDGSKIKITVPSLSENHKLLQIKEKGLPQPNTGTMGSLIVRVVYDMPNKQLTDKQKELLKEFYDNDQTK